MIFTPCPQKKPDREQRKVEPLGMKLSGEEGASACCLYAPPSQGSPKALESQGSRERNWPFIAHDRRLAQPQVSDFKLPAVPFCWVQPPDAVSRLRSPQARKGLKSPVNRSASRPAPPHPRVGGGCPVPARAGIRPSGWPCFQQPRQVVC